MRDMNWFAVNLLTGVVTANFLPSFLKTRSIVAVGFSFSLFTMSGVMLRFMPCGVTFCFFFKDWLVTVSSSVFF